ncbi:hypothetical protein RhiJN_26445 [Ceratobasidium sp. AG-Ba]|nr:hypothetical protein RhiJN_26445 [Ceratobasidium sp. AG-Ba]
MRPHRLVLALVPLLNLHATRTFASQSVLSAVMSTSTLTQQVSKLGNGVEVQNSGIQLDGKRRQIVEDALNLFSSQPSQDIFHRSWRLDATFEDPLSKCIGYKQYAPQWFQPKAFPTSRTLAYKVISSTENPNRIVYEQKQEYTIRFIGTKKIMDSTVVIDLDENDKIIKLEDKWNGQDQPTRFGTLWLRRLNAVTLPWLVKVPKPREE